MDSFYKDLKASAGFSEVFVGNNFVKVPEDWFLLITDIVGSTKAIELGRYKDVNTAGGLAAIAVANVYGHMDFPFLFGGDGVTFLLPVPLLFPIRSAIADTISSVRKTFGLEMRAGIVPVQELYQAGTSLYVSKFRASEHYVQCSLFGDAIPLAEEWIKTGKEESFLVRENEAILPADFTGFTCRWQDIPSGRGEIVSLIVSPKADDEHTAKLVVRDTLDQIRKIYGEESEYHPVRVEALELDSGPYLKKEALVTSKGKGNLIYTLRLAKIWIERIITGMSIRWKLPLKSFHYILSKLKDYQRLSADFRKYDGTLKMVLDGSASQRKALESYLSLETSKKRLEYGIFVSNRSLMTCVLKVGTAEEVHFVDGADGGFAMAAKQLKQKLSAKLEQNL